MKIEVDNIVVTLTPHEAKVLFYILHFQDEGDPNGETCRYLGIDISEVVGVLQAFEDGLQQRFPLSS